VVALDAGLFLQYVQAGTEPFTGDGGAVGGAWVWYRVVVDGSSNGSHVSNIQCLGVGLGCL